MKPQFSKTTSPAKRAAIKRMLAKAHTPEANKRRSEALARTLAAKKKAAKIEKPTKSNGAAPALPAQRAIVATYKPSSEAAMTAMYIEDRRIELATRVVDLVNYIVRGQ